MNVNFSSVDENYIKRMIEDGFYSDATELVRDAVKRMREQDDEKRTRLQAAIQAGQDDVNAGRVTAYTQDFMDRCEDRARKNVAQGRKPKADVLP
jgi:antitoxin ParD1/3/4